MAAKHASGICVITHCCAVTDGSAVIRRVTDDVWTETVSEDLGPGSVTRADVVISGVSMTTTTSLRLPELISHMEGICVSRLRGSDYTVDDSRPATDRPTPLTPWAIIVMRHIPHAKIP